MTNKQNSAISSQQGTTETLYGPIDAELASALENIKLLALDVDGIFSDGRIYMGNGGEEFKAFHTLDGYGIKAIQKIGIKVAVITGRRSNIVEQRMKSLGVSHIIQGEENKSDALRSLQQQLGLTETETASAGDDMPDLGMFALSKIAFSVPGGHPYVKRHADYITVNQGGFGAVREMCDLLLQSKGELTTSHGSST